MRNPFFFARMRCSFLSCWISISYKTANKVNNFVQQSY